MEVSFKRHITGLLSSSVTFNESHHMSKKKKTNKNKLLYYITFSYITLISSYISKTSQQSNNVTQDRYSVVCSKEKIVAIITFGND